jgi:type IV fimbrial biogenesis protein FimT
MNLQHLAAAALAAAQPQTHYSTASRNTPPRACAPRRTAPSRQRGITLIELLVVLAIIAIVAGFAIPSFLGLIASTHVSRTVNAFVTICRSANPSANPPKCSSGNGVAVGGWKEGWVVFADEDSDGAFDGSADTVLRVQEALANSGNFLAVNNAGGAVNNRNHISYDASGRAVGLQSRWLVQAAGALASNRSYTRTLCMNIAGRVRIQAGETSCA